MTARLLDLCERYAAATGVSLSRVSTLVFNDGKALARIGAGGDLNTRSFERAIVWLSANWPAAAAWPKDFARPEPTEAAS